MLGRLDRDIGPRDAVRAPPLHVGGAGRREVDQPAQPESGVRSPSGHRPPSDRVEDLRSDHIAHVDPVAGVQGRAEKVAATGGVNAIPPSHAPIAFHTTGMRNASPANAGNSQIS